jgi:phosphohistidine phosphatase
MAGKKGKRETMKTIMLMRHGKSDWGADTRNDHDRPLTQRGVKAARRIGRWLAAAERAPDLVVTSTAVRAQTTVELAAEAGAWSCPIHATQSLYGADIETTLAEVHGLPARVERVLLAGHEPTWSSFVSRLIGGGNICFPTAAVAAVELDVRHWQEVAVGAGTLLWMIVPRLLSDSA